jgi:PAS domain S-box-containing protein
MLSVVAVAAAVGLRALLDPILGERLALVTLFGAVAAAVWLGGARPAILVAILGYLACDYLFVEPRNVLHFDDAAEIVSFVAYSFTTAIIIAFGETLRRAERNAETRREALRITLASMGDAVVTTDERGQVTSLNAVAAALTGWSPEEADGRPLEDVFRIVNEDDRTPVENPALRALREGRIVGLANHTLLIRKDGTELPIDDSAAPVYDDDSRMRGCVLLFRDVSEKRRAQRELAASERRFRDIFDRVAVSLWEEDFGAVRHELVALRERGVTDLARWLDDHPSELERLVGLIRIADVNAASVSLFEAQDKAQLLDSFPQIFLPETRGTLIAELVAVAEGQEYHEGETRLRTLRGRCLDVYFTMVLPPPTDDSSYRVLFSVTDISFRKQAEAALVQADRRKDEFLATLAHELRGPLAPLRNALELIKRAQGDRDMVESSRSTMERQLAQLVRLVDDLIDVSRISRGRIDLRMERIDLASVIQQSIETCRALVPCTDQHIEAALPARPIVVHGDRVRLTQVLTNILHNACKYSDSDGYIYISASVEDGHAIIRVRDAGVGIAAENLGSVFDMFSQIDRTLERSHGGLGIGLFLVRRLVEMHGGSVSAASEGLERGSEFVVRLPLPAESTLTQPETPAAAPPAPNRRFLIVDDNVDAAVSLAMLLQIGGHEAELAHDGLQALDDAGRLRPDVILLDIGLPKLNGYDVCRQIRAQPWGASVLLVALTGWGQEEDRRRSREAGFDHHLVKPVDPDELMRLLTGPELSRG